MGKQPGQGEAQEEAQEQVRGGEKTPIEEQPLSFQDYVQYGVYHKNTVTLFFEV